MEPVEEFIKIESIFVRHRNCLMLKGKFAPIFTDYYLNLMQHGIKSVAEVDVLLKELLAFFTLHLVARPWAERHAWTVALRKPHCNLFVTGYSVEEQVVGRFFINNVKESDKDILFAQFYPDQGDSRTSAIPLHSERPADWVEQYYKQSEQRSARCFELADEEFVLLVAQPDADEEWLASLSSAQVALMEEQEQTKLLETRKFRFYCGCTLEKVLPVLASWKNKPQELFGDDSEIEITCPRCAARYTVTPDMI